MPDTPQGATDVSLSEQLKSTIDSFEPADLDVITRHERFRLSTAQLMVGNVNSREWADELVIVVNDVVDLPILNEAMEARVFETVFVIFGEVLKNLIPKSKQTRLDDAVLDLMNGRMSVPDFLDVLREELNAQVDLPWVPEWAEDRFFNAGIDWMAKALHGFLTDHSTS